MLSVVFDHFKIKSPTIIGPFEMVVELLPVLVTKA